VVIIRSVVVVVIVFIVGKLQLQPPYLHGKPRNQAGVGKDLHFERSSSHGPTKLRVRFASLSKRTPDRGYPDGDR
jgi:hypothetical protein